MEKEFKCKKCGYESDEPMDFIKSQDDEGFTCNDCVPQEKQFKLDEKRKILFNQLWADLQEQNLTLRQIFDDCVEVHTGLDEEFIKKYIKRLNKVGVDSGEGFKIIGVDNAIFELKQLTGDLK